LDVVVAMGALQPLPEKQHPPRDKVVSNKAAQSVFMN
jgi:hypothetical protein